MKGTKIVIVKPYTSECHQLTVGKRSPRDDMLLEQKYGASPNRVNLPGEDLFIQNREDVAHKLTLRRKKGYFNEPKDMSKILKAKPKAVKFKSITNPEFTIQNNLKYNQTVVLGDNFKNIAHPSEPSKKIHTSKYNISEFKITGLGDDTAMTIQQSRGMVLKISELLFLLLLE